LAENGFIEFWNWFDAWSWYPIGRVIGNTLFPGLMCSSAVINMLLRAIGLQVTVRDTCVFFAPIFAGFT